MARHGWKFVGLILVAALVFLWLIKAPIMSTYLSDKLGINITMRMISMWPKTTTIRYLKIGNPHGFHPRTAFEVEKTQIHYRFGALTSHPSEIDLITLDGVTLNIDIQSVPGTNNNWSALGSQFPAKKEGRRVIVHKLILRNMNVNTTGKGAKLLGVAGKQHFDQMEFNEIDSSKGFPTKELIGKIFEGAGLRKYIENFLNPTQRIKDTLNPFNIFGQKETPEMHPEGLD
jgi:hypothetical protein